MVPPIENSKLTKQAKLDQDFEENRIKLLTLVKHVQDKYGYADKVLLTRELPVRHARAFFILYINSLAYHRYLQTILSISNTIRFVLTEEGLRLVAEAGFSLQEALTFTSLQDI